MIKAIKISNVRGIVRGERRTFDAIIRVNGYNTVVSGILFFPEGGREYLDSHHITTSLKAKLGRLARRAAKAGQEIVDWSAL